MGTKFLSTLSKDNDTAPPTTTKGDLSGYSSTQARVPVGTNNQVLTADSTTALGVAYKTPVTPPTTTKGDLSGYSTAQARIPIGTNNQVLTADSGQALGLKWATPSAGTWSTLASTILTSANATIDSGSFTAKEYLLIQCRLKGTSASATSVRYKFNSVVTSTYDYTYSLNGLNGESSVSQTEINPLGVDGTASTDYFINVFVYNVATENKLALSHGMTKTSVMNSTIGSALWNETTNQITSVQFFQETGGYPSGKWDIGSEVVVLGYDP